MKKALQLIQAFKRDEEGAAMVEYTILIGMMTVAAIIFITAVGVWVVAQWSALALAL